MTCALAVGWQNLAAQGYLNYASDHARLYVGRLEPQYQLTLWHDNPYYKDDLSMYVGRISYHGVVYDNVKLRYDLFKQKIAVQSPTTNAYCLPEQEYIDWFELDGYRYVHDPADADRYVAVISDGSRNGVRLYRYIWKEYIGDAPFNGKYLKLLEYRESFIIVTADGKSHHVKSLSDVVKIFPDQKDRLKAFSKENHLEYRGKLREIGLSRLVSAIEGKCLPKSSLKGNQETATNLQKTESKSNLASASNRQPAPSLWDKNGEQSIISGIPVLDSDTMSVMAASGTRTYIVPGVRKAKVSIADDHELDEILVVGGRPSAVRNSIMGSEKFKPELHKNIPSAFGEADIMKIALTLPGVTSVGEASSGINVRGGATDQNLILFNGGTVYNPSHLFGLFTSFNSDMVEEVELYKASIPARYGGRISSVMTVTSKEANMKKLTGNVSLGTLTSKANIEIPVVQDHVSLLLNGRTTYSDWILKRLPEKSGYRNGSANFYDFGGVLTVKLNNMHKLKINGYLSNDKFAFSSDDNYRYVNRNLSAEWRSILGEKLTGTLSFGVDHYDYYNEDHSDVFKASRLSFAIDMLWAKLNFRHRLGEKTSLTYGLCTQSYDVMAGKYEPVGKESLVKSDKLDNEKALESAAYVDIEHRFTDKLTLLGGIRYSMFNSLGPRDVNYYSSESLPSETTLLETIHKTGVIKTYQSPEYRLSTRYAIMDNLSVKAGFNTMTQNIHKVSNSTIMSPTDIWKLSDYNIKPQHGWQISTGVYYETNDKQYEFSAEVYTKRMTDYLSYRNSAVLLMNHHLETDVISTNGKAYGVELQAKKPTGKLNGWLSYTYSRTFLRQEDSRAAMLVNDGDWFVSEYDRPHEVKAVLNYKFTERYSLSGNFNYATGRPTTIPAGRYYNQQLNIYLPYYTERNSYRIPDYLRFDFAFNIEPTHKLTSFLHTSFSIGAYNAFARKNAYNIYYVTEQAKVQGYKLSVFGSIIPYFSLNIRLN